MNAIVAQTKKDLTSLEALTTAAATFLPPILLAIGYSRLQAA